MSILVMLVIVIIVVALLIYGIDLVPQIAPFAGLLKLVVILVAVLWLLTRAGLV
jgi:hypothetical protein